MGDWSTTTGDIFDDDEGEQGSISQLEVDIEDRKNSERLSGGRESERQS